MNSHASLTHIDFSPRGYEQLLIHLDRQYKVAWCYMQPTGRPCFSAALLSNLINWCEFVGQNASCMGIKYHVIASNTPYTFSLGGDLELFKLHIRNGDRQALLEYGMACIDPLHANIRHFDQDVTTLSLVQGHALGGGFETALSSDVVIAERQARLGFPEIMFNLFPGMGAYSLLARKLDPKRAEKMILSGKIYAAEELHEEGLIDILVDEGDGEEAVYDYIKRENRAPNGFRALRKVRDYVNPISHEELAHIVEIWVDAAMRLNERDLRMMGRLVARQQHQVAAAA